MKAKIDARARVLAFAVAALASGAAQAWEFPLGYAFGQAELDGHAEYANNNWNDSSFSSFGGGGGESSGRFFVGAYPVPYFGLEYGVVDFGTSKVSAQSNGCCLYFAGPVTHRLSADGSEFSLVGRIPAGKKASVVLRLGQLKWEGEERIDASNGFAEGTDDGSDMFYGLGADFRLGNRFLLRGEYTRYSLGDFDATRLSVGLALVLGRDPPAAQ